MNITVPFWSFVKIGSGNGLVPSANKPLPEPMLTQLFRLPIVLLGPNELSNPEEYSKVHCYQTLI